MVSVVSGWAVQGQVAELEGSSHDKILSECLKECNDQMLNIVEFSVGGKQ